MSSIIKSFSKEVHIAPLVTFRIIFGAMMMASMIRFWLKGWIFDLYVAPQVFFSYYGFGWVKPLTEIGMYALFGGLIISSLFIALGFLYRYAATFFFLAFTYVELIDKSNYLNHYYFITIMAGLMVFMPAHRYFSLDERLGLVKTQTHIQQWLLGALKLQLGIVYFFAGIAKINYDWLVRAMPLKLWLPAHSSLPLVGGLFTKTWVAHAFSWFGALYDLFIPFALLIKKYRVLAYSMVLGFHLITGYLFQIGMFPYIMILATLIFFSESFHKRAIQRLGNLLNYTPRDSVLVAQQRGSYMPLFKYALIGHFIFQLIFPFRYVFYGENLFWHEQGYRFSWRVMLMEKTGQTFFYAQDSTLGIKTEIDVSKHLTPWQEKQMATQPDMILQFADILKEELRKEGFQHPEVYAESYVTLNGSGSRPFIDSQINLCELDDSWSNKTWILPFDQ